MPSPIGKRATGFPNPSPAVDSEASTFGSGREPNLVACDFKIPSKAERRSPKSSPKGGKKPVNFQTEEKKCGGTEGLGEEVRVFSLDSRLQRSSDRMLRCGCWLTGAMYCCLQPSGLQASPSKHPHMEQLAAELDAVAILDSKKAPGNLRLLQHPSCCSGDPVLTQLLARLSGGRGRAVPWIAEAAETKSGKSQDHPREGKRGPPRQGIADARRRCAIFWHSEQVL